MTVTTIILWTFAGIDVIAAGVAIRFAIQAARSARRIREIRRGR